MCSYARCSFELVSQIENPEEELATDTSFFSYHIENPSILRLRFGFTREKAFSFLSFFPGGAARAGCLTLLQADSLTLGAGVKCHCAPAPYSYTYFSIHRFFLGRCRRNCTGGTVLISGGNRSTRRPCLYGGILPVKDCRKNCFFAK